MEKGKYLTAILRSPKTVFTLRDIALLWGEPSSHAATERLHDYVRKGNLLRIRRGLYAKDRHYSKLELATRIFVPSYVSFESILAREGLSFQFYTEISVATYLTRTITVDGQVYAFRRVKNSILTNPAGIEFKEETSLATRERAFLDTLYVHTDYQFDNLANLDWERVFELLPIYHNKRMAKKVQVLYRQAGNHRNNHETRYINP